MRNIQELIQKRAVERKARREAMATEIRPKMMALCEELGNGLADDPTEFDLMLSLMVRRGELVAAMAGCEALSPRWYELSKDIVETCEVYLAPYGLV